jgi:hypothetical protein
MRPSGSRIGIAGLRLLGLLQLAALCHPLLGQGVIATIAGGSKIFPVGSLPALTTDAAAGRSIIWNGHVDLDDTHYSQNWRGGNHCGTLAVDTDDDTVRIALTGASCK